MENIFKDKKVLLISDMLEDYKNLESLGFSNILFMRSMRDADSFFYNNIEELEECFIIITSFQSDIKSLIDRNITLPNDIKNLKGRKHFYEAQNSRMPFPWVLELYIKVPEDKIDEKWDIDNKNLISIINGCLVNLGYEEIVPKYVPKPINTRAIKTNVIEKIVINDKEVFDHIKEMTSTFLRLKENGYILPKGINIYEIDSCIRIEYMVEGVIIGAITYPLEDIYDVTFIKFEMINNKGKLIKNEVGIYPIDYEDVTVRKINGLEFKFLKIIESKLAEDLKFLEINKPYVLKNRLW